MLDLFSLDSVGDEVENCFFDITQVYESLDVPLPADLIVPVSSEAS